METTNLLATIKDAYHHNWVIELKLKRQTQVTGMVNTYFSDGHFYLTHEGDIEQFSLADLETVKVLSEKWWQTAAES
ncbi:hypothetical protein [Secundilactobacillus kimchicus]|uniref:WYL domain-containing protein n=1 Tax=Secundilactobacillus kimchicus JCM 15530 TaxID=1302272 RepID=A0A0R1HPB1_9LACO|nr:hypothetical protein [Secundilactobacillus kimchicus]KRK48701.1 hypothetical protein FC96_GL001018 [Secundilactobacillus kimchicus JCM 15530]MBT9672079.1 hypothetical protein [Secundilactobacillus kimchicus]